MNNGEVEEAAKTLGCHELKEVGYGKHLTANLNLPVDINGNITVGLALKMKV